MLIPALGGCSLLFGGPSDAGLDNIDFVESAPRQIKGTSFENEDFEVIETHTDGDRVFTPAFLGAFNISDTDVSAIDVIASGKVAYVGTRDGAVHRVSIKSNQSGRVVLTEELIIRGTRPIISLAISPDEKRLAISQFSQVTVFDLPQKKKELVLTRVAGRLSNLTWDPKGELIAFGRETGEAYIWNLTKVGSGGGNNIRSVEQYGTASDASVVSIVFHPLARSFYLLQQNGTVQQWRLLRTESELGLRDEWAVVDREPMAEEVLTIGYLAGKGEDMKISPDGEELVAADTTGVVRHWRIRGRSPREDFFVGADSSTAFEIVPHSLLAGRVSAAHDDLLITAGRGFFLKASCWSPYVRPDISSGQVTILTKEPDDSDQKAAIVGGLLVSTEERKEHQASVNEIRGAETSKYLLAKSPNLTFPVSTLKRGKLSTILWAVQKKGTLLAFDFKRAKLNESCKR